MYRINNSSKAKPSLRRLTNEYLGEIIQDGEHDSVIDALSALRLAKLKVVRGHKFGVPKRKSVSIFSALASHGKSCSLVAANDVCKKQAASPVSVFSSSSSSQRMQNMIKIMKKSRADLIVMHIPFSGGKGLEESKVQLDSIWESCPPSSLLLLLSGDSIPLRSSLPNGDDSEAKTQRESIISEAKKGYCILSLKPPKAMKS